jgi:hypothetical protein
VQNLFVFQFAAKNLKIKVYRTIILCVVLYGSLISREEHKLRVFENRVLRRVFGPKRDEVTGEWRRVYNEGFYALYFSPNILVIRSGRIDVWGM